MSDMHRHGSPYDRGSADAYYERLFCPHYFKGATYQSEYVTIADMTIDEIEQYEQGFNECTERKDWGSDEHSAAEPPLVAEPLTLDNEDIDHETTLN
jgi:hypothetical protein